MSPLAPMSRPSVQSALLAPLLVLGFLFVLLRPAAAQQAVPDPGRPPSANPLCDGTAVPCLDIDDLAAHAYVHVQVLPRTDQRDTVAVLPFGIALGLFGRVAGTGCTDPTGHVHPIGTQYYREHGHLWICAAPRTEEQRDSCFLALAELPQKMHNQTTPLGRIARALDHGAVRKAQAIDKIPDQVVNTADGVAQGRITAGTVVGAIEAKAKDIAEHASIDAAKGWIKGKLQGAREWVSKPPIEQGEDLAEEAGDAMIPHPVTVGATVITGALGRGVVGVAGELEEVANAGNAARKVEKKAAQAVHAGERKASSPGKMQQEVLRGQAPRDVHRVDRPHVSGGEAHVHFCDGTSCNQSGTIHDAHKGAPNPSGAARDWLQKHGWAPPPKK